jgi:branched-subunit amino acid transport protein
MSLGLAIAAVAAVGFTTYLSRAGFILFFAERPLPTEVVRALRYVGPAVLSALTVLFVAGGRGVAGIGVEEIAGVVVAGLVAARTRNPIWSLVTGMLAVWLVAAIT